MKSNYRRRRRNEKYFTGNNNEYEFLFNGHLRLSYKTLLRMDSGRKSERKIYLNKNDSYLTSIVIIISLLNAVLLL